MTEVPAFDALVGALDYPLFIVTTRVAETRAGCLIGFAGQVSIHPPRFLACLSDKNRTYRVASGGAEHLAVHLVPERAMELAELFGGTTGDEVDKFARCAWHDGPCGQPVLDECTSWFVGRVVERVALGDHVGFLLEPVAAEHAAVEGELDFQRARGIEPGHEP